MTRKSRAVDFDVTNNVTPNLQYLMKKEKIRSNELARRINISAELIGKIKNGISSNPTLRTLERICNYFKITLQDFVYKRLNDDSPYGLITFVPLIAWDNILKWETQNIGSTATDAFLNADGIFSLKMESDTGLFKKGSTIFVDTNGKFKGDDVVLIQSKKTSAFYLKRIIVEEHTYLQSLVSEITELVKYNDKEYNVFGVIMCYQTTRFLNGREVIIVKKL